MPVEALKVLGMVTMSIDHMGALGLLGDFSLEARYIGRLAFPIFAYLMATGFRFTKNKEKHLFFLGVFALISEVPFDLAHGSLFDMSGQNVMFTFFFATLSIYGIHKIRDEITGIVAVFVVISSGFAVYYLSTDYNIYGFTLVLCFYAFEDAMGLDRCREEIRRFSPKEGDGISWIREKDYCQTATLLAVNMFSTLFLVNMMLTSFDITFLGVTFSLQMFALLAMFPLCAYIFSGQKKVLTGTMAKGFKWFSYSFYPVHLFILSLF